MGHYDEQRDAYEDALEDKFFLKNGISRREDEELKKLQREIAEYVSFEDKCERLDYLIKKKEKHEN